ncbi:MAG: ZIP family metal transporter [Candidatus ainarchaeum sp.]|nr:ZIP family metal transporter [Candidatus ainarchaeum sp.]
MIFLYILAAVLIVSVISLIGIGLLGLKEKKFRRITGFLVSFSAGTMLGGAFLHLLPEAVEVESSLNPFLLVLGGIMLFFIIEKILCWRHCHDGECEVHAVAHLNLIGDFVHNFMDGVAIAAAFLLSIPTGIATTFAIAAHEIPQEIGDFALLINSGLTKKKAILYNFISALGALGGAIAVYLFAATHDSVLFLMPIAAGGFIYMAGTDIMPQLHKEKKGFDSILQLGLLLAGIILMWIMKLYFEAS